MAQGHRPPGRRPSHCGRPHPVLRGGHLRRPRLELRSVRAGPGPHDVWRPPARQRPFDRGPPIPPARRRPARIAGRGQSAVVRYQALLGACAWRRRERSCKAQGTRKRNSTRNCSRAGGRSKSSVTWRRPSRTCSSTVKGLVACYNNLSILHRKNDNPDEAIACQRKALEIGEPKVATRAGLLLVGPTLSHVLLNLAEQEILRGDWAAARPLFERHRDLLTRLIAEIRESRTSATNCASPSSASREWTSERAGSVRPSATRGESWTLALEILRDNPDLALTAPPDDTVGSLREQTSRPCRCPAGTGAHRRPFPSTRRESPSWKTRSAGNPWASTPPFGSPSCERRGRKLRQEWASRAEAEAPAPETARGPRRRVGRVRDSSNKG